jgi:hypothetical protein
MIGNSRCWPLGSARVVGSSCFSSMNTRHWGRWRHAQTCQIAHSGDRRWRSTGGRFCWGVLAGNGAQSEGRERLRRIT